MGTIPGHPPAALDAARIPGARLPWDGRSHFWPLAEGFRASDCKVPVWVAGALAWHGLPRFLVRAEPQFHLARACALIPWSPGATEIQAIAPPARWAGHAADVENRPQPALDACRPWISGEPNFSFFLGNHGPFAGGGNPRGGD
jgi:hypothetical protein